VFDVYLANINEPEGSSESEHRSSAEQKSTAEEVSVGSDDPFAKYLQELETITTPPCTTPEVAPREAKSPRHYSMSDTVKDTKTNSRHSVHLLSPDLNGTHKKRKHFFKRLASPRSEQYASPSPSIQDQEAFNNYIKTLEEPDGLV
jgi:hypothetical protein